MIQAIKKHLPDLQIMLGIKAYEISVKTQLYINSLFCRYDHHQLGKWNYPSNKSREHYIAKTKWRNCERHLCGYQESVQEFSE